MDTVTQLVCGNCNEKLFQIEAISEPVKTEGNPYRTRTLVCQGCGTKRVSHVFEKLSEGSPR